MSHETSLVGFFHKQESKRTLRDAHFIGFEKKSFKQVILVQRSLKHTLLIDGTKIMIIIIEFLNVDES
jgi:hypothetical protein